MGSLPTLLVLWDGPIKVNLISSSFHFLDILQDELKIKALYFQINKLLTFNCFQCSFRRLYLLLNPFLCCRVCEVLLQCHGEVLCIDIGERRRQEVQVHYYWPEDGGCRHTTTDQKTMCMPTTLLLTRRQCVYLLHYNWPEDRMFRHWHNNTDHKTMCVLSTLLLTRRREV